MKIAIFGGTGGTGLQLIKQALQVGHHVKALLRTPSKLKIQNENIEIIKGDVIEGPYLKKCLFKKTIKAIDIEVLE